MYYDYFGLKQPPFKITPDTSLFFPGGNRGVILEAIVYAVLNGEGIIKVVGEVGSGKTMLCRMLQKEMPDTVEIVYLANPSLSPENILHAIAFELKLPVRTNSSRLQVMNKLQEYLLRKHSANQQIVVFVEEAQSMPIATLEEIRLLSNLETQQNKLLQIVLFGQPELDQMIAQREIRQLKERITYSFQLNPFEISDIKEYLNARLRSCGYRSGEIFTPQAVKKITKYSNGLVRRINILADKSLLAAYATNNNQVTASHVKQAARDSEFMGNWKRRFWQPAALTTVLISLIGVLVVWQQTKITEYSSPVVRSDITSVSSAADTIVAQKNDSASILAKHNRLSVQVKDGNYIEQLNTGSIIDPKSTVVTEDIVAITPKDDMTKPATPQEVNITGLKKNLDRPSQRTSLGIEIEQQLIGLEQVFDVQDTNGSELSAQEVIILRRQLETLPPEDVFQLESSLSNDICKLCWAFIYRPLIRHEKL